MSGGHSYEAQQSVPKISSSNACVDEDYTHQIPGILHIQNGIRASFVSVLPSDMYRPVPEPDMSSRPLLVVVICAVVAFAVVSVGTLSVVHIYTPQQHAVTTAGQLRTATGSVPMGHRAMHNVPRRVALGIGTAAVIGMTGTTPPSVATPAEVSFQCPVSFACASLQIER